MASLIKIKALKHTSGRRVWYYYCRECADARGESRNFFSVGKSTRWLWALEDANLHLEMYH